VYAQIIDRAKNPKEKSYTNYLLDAGLDKICKKLGEETTETIIQENRHEEEQDIPVEPEESKEPEENDQQNIQGVQGSQINPDEETEQNEKGIEYTEPEPNQPLTESQTVPTTPAMPENPPKPVENIESAEPPPNTEALTIAELPKTTETQTAIEAPTPTQPQIITESSVIPDNTTNGIMTLTYKGKPGPFDLSGNIIAEGVQWLMYEYVPIEDFYYDVALAKAGVLPPKGVESVKLQDITHLYLCEKMMGKNELARITVSQKQVEMVFWNLSTKNQFGFTYSYDKNWYPRTPENRLDRLILEESRGWFEFTDDIFYRKIPSESNWLPWYQFLWIHDDIIMQITCEIGDDSVEDRREEIMSYINSIFKTPIEPFLPDIKMP